jgi:hypothetical protein
MAIILVSGEDKSGKSIIANALRSHQINNQMGALLIDEGNDGEVDILLEKILVGVNLPSEIPDGWEKKLPWKKNPAIILVGEKLGMLAVFEERLPGFTKNFGPVYTVKTGITA